MKLLCQSDATQTRTVQYAFFDGDNIGNTIENLLNNGRIREATYLSESIKLAIFQIELFINSTNDVKLIIAGGDDVLIEYNTEKYNYTFLEKVSKIFNKHTGLSMSCGVGENISEAISNLASAKQHREGIIKYTDEEIKVKNRYMKPIKLYIFATSLIPDPYINVIAHCAVNYPSVNEVIIIGITADRGKIGSENSKLIELKQKISNQLENLSKGKYPKKKENNDEKWELASIEIEDADCQRYSNLKNIDIKTEAFGYQDLENKISQWLNIDTASEHLFDVTAVSKSYLIDVYTILRYKKISTIYVFQVFSPPHYDERDLIHNLVYGETYKYTCIAESAYTENRIVVSDNCNISQNDFNKLNAEKNSLNDEKNKLNDEKEILERNIKKIEDELATNFARFWFALFLILIFLPIFLRICWWILQPEGWNRFEPSFFLVSSAWAVLTYSLPIFFTRNFSSLNILSLPHALKKWKLKKLEKSRLDSRS
jgi:minimal CRISPR polymerase domain